MYENLVKQLRYCANDDSVCEQASDCPYYDKSEEDSGYYFCTERMMSDAADAIAAMDGVIDQYRQLLDRYGGETGIKNLEEFAGKYWDALAQIPRWTPVAKQNPDKPGTYLVAGNGEYSVEVWLCQFAEFGSSRGWINDVRRPVIDCWTTIPEFPRK